MKSTAVRATRSALALAIGLAAAGIARAQEGESRTTQLEDIIVTAERREASLQDTPISAVAFGADALEKFNVDDLGDIQHNVPNLYMRQFPNSQASLRTYMRGVGNNDVGMSTDPSVAVYMDGVYVARSIGLGNQVASIERIEVLRGPQGSLYGRNSIGGAINIVTAKPTGEFGVKLGASAGDRNYMRARAELDTARVNGFAAKLSVLGSQKDGWVRNRGPGADFGDDKSTGARFALNWSPTANFSADYAFDYTDSDYGTIYYQNIGPSYPGFGSVPYGDDRLDNVRARVPFEESTLKIKGHSLTLAWEFSDTLTLKSITGYRELEQDVYQDYGANRFTDRLYANAPFDNQQEQFSQEFQAIGSLFDNQLEYAIGAYYFEEEGDEYTTDYITLPLLPGGGLLEIELPTRDSTAKNDANAIYGQFTWNPPVLDDRLHLTVGVRRSEDKREIRTDAYFSGFQFFHVNTDGNWKNTSWDGTIAFDVTDNLNVYAKYVEGYKTGGFNIRATNTYAATKPLGSEIVESVEAGIKAQFLDNRIRLNAAVFSNDYSDIQLSFAVLNDPTNVVLYNAGTAKIKGFELDLTAVITEGLVATLGYGYLDTDVKPVDDPETPAFDPYPAVLPSAPDNSLTFDLEYTFPSFGFGELVADVNYSKVDEADFVSFVRRGYNIPKYDLWNARITLREIQMGSGTGSVALWGKNLADEEYLLDGIEGFPWTPMSAPFGESRTWGVDFTFEF